MLRYDIPFTILLTNDRRSDALGVKLGHRRVRCPEPPH